jgi:hypothetical protein
MAFQVGPFQTNYQQVSTVVTPSRPSGGGRIIGYLPDYPKKKRKVEVKWTDEHDKELIRLLKQIDEEYEKKRRQQYEGLINILRDAIHLGNQVSFSGFNYLTAEDIRNAKQKIQQEEEAILLLLML